MRYSHRIHQLESEGAFVLLARAKLLEAQGKSIIHLQIGEPDFDTPSNISYAAIDALKAGETHYAPSGGIPEARAAVAKYMSLTRGITISPDEVVVYPGCKPVIFATMMALVEPGDEIIIPDPGYPTYRSVAKFLDAVPVPVRYHEHLNFRFQLGDVEKAITPKTKAIVINSPANPTGGVLTVDDLKGVLALAEKHDLWVIADEIYSRIVYEEPFHSIGSLPGALDRCVLIDGASKTFAMTGWRLGFGAMPKKLADYLFTFAINNFSSTCTFAQYGLIEALQGTQEPVEAMLREFRQRRDVMVAEVNKIPGMHCLTPEGAFYVFANIQETGLTGKQFSDLMLDEAGVACLHGSAFGAGGEGYVRFSYANSVENIREAMHRIRGVLSRRLVKTPA